MLRTVILGGFMFAGFHEGFSLVLCNCLLWTYYGVYFWEVFHFPVCFDAVGILERICKDSDEDKLLGPLHEEKQDVMGHCKRGSLSTNVLISTCTSYF